MLALAAAITALVYLVATGAHLATVIQDRKQLAVVGQRATLAGLFGHVLLVGLLLGDGGLERLLGPAEGVCLGGLAITVAYALLGWRFGLGSLGSFVTPLSALSVIVLAVEVGGEGPPTSYESALLPIHVTLAFLGTAAFVFALVLAVVYVIQERELKLKRFSGWSRRLPNLDKLDTYVLRSVSVGFVLYTLSLILGLFSQWRSDGLSLEIRSGLSLLTWTIYGLIIQARITAGWRGKRAAQLIIVGAVCAIGVVAVYLTRAPG